MTGCTVRTRRPMGGIGYGRGRRQGSLSHFALAVQQHGGRAMKSTDIRPFHVDVPQEALDDLDRRIASTRWPTTDLVQDRSQGVQLAAMQELAQYWTGDYDWRKNEARLNALPQFKTEIDGLNIDFIHVQ